MGQLHYNSDGTVSPDTPGPHTRHEQTTTAPKPANLDDIPSIKAYTDEQDKKAGR